MKTLCRVYQYLKDQQVSYQSFFHKPALSAQRLAQVEGMSGRCHAKAVIVWTNRRMAMVVLDADHEIDFTKLAEALRVGDVRLAAESEFFALFPDCRLGALPPFGNLYDMDVLLDARLAKNEVLCFPDGTPEGAIVMSMRDYQRLVHPRIASIAMPSLAAA